MNHAYQQNIDNQSEDVQSPDPSYSGMTTPFVAIQPHERAVISALLAGVLHDESISRARCSHLLVDTLETTINAEAGASPAGPLSAGALIVVDREQTGGIVHERPTSEENGSSGIEHVDSTLVRTSTLGRDCRS